MIPGPGLRLCSGHLCHSVAGPNWPPRSGSAREHVSPSHSVASRLGTPRLEQGPGVHLAASRSQCGRRVTGSAQRLLPSYSMGNFTHPLGCPSRDVWSACHTTRAAALHGTVCPPLSPQDAASQQGQPRARPSPEASARCGPQLGPVGSGAGERLGRRAAGHGTRAEGHNLATAQVPTRFLCHRGSSDFWASRNVYR